MSELQSQLESRGWQLRLLRAKAPSARPVVWAAPISQQPVSTLTVFLEGDGRAWLTPNRPSSDPTPVNAVGLQTAWVHPGPVAWIARPCQYTVPDLACKVSDWTTGRFSEEIVGSVSAALDQIKAVYQAQSIELVGYSGGAAIALLLATRRTDVVWVGSFAGNVDPVGWTELHRLTPLKESLSTTQDLEKLARLPQHHWVGSADQVIPLSLVTSYADRVNQLGGRVRVTEVYGMNHQCCWSDRWQSLWQLR